ncbi:NTP transferase domain-containing protein [Methanothermobacter sp.]|uniref:nucleotidyltransferase family protein n=1 Tax=Methanothermobacter sp. TaxID=1884223 RepID=UPI0026099791|nr:NTP transferase domain-containing protein [Methanothermobacter sp.]MDI9617511.1 NTP transferase domain-containing protein [Methanothermobacter sp.]
MELISAVVTAAGRGSRMFRDMQELGLEPVHKLLLPIDSVTVIEKTLDSVLRAGVDECIVVTGHHAGEVEEAIAGMDVEIVRNDPPDVPLAASLLNGVLSASGEIILCVAGDQPAVSPGTMGRISEHADPETVSILARGRSGWLDSAEGLGMPLAASSELLRRYLPMGDGNINPLLRLMVDDGIRLYGVEASDPIELVNINHYSDYLRIMEYFGVKGE